MNFDLTTKKGVEEANTWTDKAKKLAAILPILSLSPLSGVFFAYKLLSSDDENLKQAKAAEALIEAGKRNGVKKMTITLDNEVGLHLSGKMKGVNVKARAGSKGKINLEVEYK
jgi:hypothetical protein